MRIPDEIQTQADNLYWDREHKYKGLGCAEEAYEFVAEWARREALREAVSAVTDAMPPAPLREDHDYYAGGRRDGFRQAATVIGRISARRAV